MNYAHRGLIQPQHGAPDHFHDLLEQLRQEWDEMKRRNAGEWEQQRDGISKDHF